MRTERNYKHAIVLFIKNEKLNNNKVFSFRETYDLFNKNIEQLIASVKKEISSDVILCSDNSTLINHDLFIKQTGKSFDDKFNNAIDKSFELGYEKIVVIGNDSPDLKPQHIIESFLDISSEKIVIGPSHDGGIYLLGLSSKATSSKINARWNTSHVKNDLLKSFGNKEVVLLDFLFDIDCESDLHKWYTTNSLSANLFQKLLSTETLVRHKDNLSPDNHSTEKTIFRVYTQKAPPVSYALPIN